jgi:hypothetical protein
MTETIIRVTLSEHLKAALAYAGGLRALLEALERGELVDPTALEREVGRIERSVASALHLVCGAPEA